MRRPLFTVCLCLVILIGCLAGESDKSGPDGKQCVVTGRVYQRDNQYFYLKSIDSFYLNYEAANQQQKIPFTENLICEYDKAVDVVPGSVVQVSGVFSAFSKATNPGEFDEEKYYHSLKIGGKLRQVEVLEIRRAQEGNPIAEVYWKYKEVLGKLREAFKKRLYMVFPKKEASVMNAMLLGDKTELDKDIKALYQKQGIVHILSISGLHITIIGMSIYQLLRRLGIPVWLAALTGGAILLSYGIMTGLSVSASRAIGMYILRMLAEVVGRTYDMLTAMGVMALLLVCGNPGYLTHAGFYLSFGAIAGIGVLYPALLPEKDAAEIIRYEAKRWKRIIRKMCGMIGSGLKQSMLSGVSVTLMTLPIQLWFYYEVPVYSILLNLLVIPFMSTVMVCGLVAMLVPGLGILGTVDCLILNGYELLCRFFEHMPFHTWNPGRPQIWQLVMYYVFLFGLVYSKEKHFFDGGLKLKKKMFCRTIGLTIIVMLLGLRIPKKTIITFLDVGQGDCICVQLKSGEVYLFDCGSSSKYKVGEYALKSYLKYYGIHAIDAVFVSHPDEDHCNGVMELLAHGEEWGIGIKQLVLPAIETERRAAGWSRQWDDLLEQIPTHPEKGKDIPVLWIKAGDYWEVGENRFLCLHPPVNCALQDANACSQCFFVELSGGVTMLLTGDVEDEGEEMLIAELKKRVISDVTLLKVAHHGSRGSSSKAFLEQASPQLAIVSCGAGNAYGHPHEETLERLADIDAKVVTTSQYGAVSVEIRDDGVLTVQVHVVPLAQKSGI